MPHFSLSMVCVLQLQPLSNLGTFCTNMPNIMIQFMILQPESLNITFPSTHGLQYIG